MARSTVAVRFTGDAADLKRSIGDVEGKLDGIGGKVAGFAKVAAAGVAGLAVGAGAFAKSAVDSASDLNETLSKSRAVFGDASGSVEAFADNAAKMLGQSKQQALDAAGAFGNLFVQLGIGPDKAAEMSQGMVGLASDFASFHNADITEVLEAQQAAFRGEYDALQRFVPTINAAAVEQKALEMTGKATTKELTLQEKALATQRLMMEGAGDAAGDFSRTSDGLANKQRIMAARFEDVKAKIGQGLLPVVTKLAEFVTDKVIPAFEKWGPKVSETVASIAAVVQEHWPRIQQVITTAIQTVVGFVQQHWPEIQRVIQTVIETVSAVISGAVSVITTLWDNFGNNILSFVQRVWPPIQQVISGVMEAIQGIIKTVTALIQGDWSAVWEGIKQVFSGVWEAIQGIVKVSLEQIRFWIGVALEVIGSVFRGAWEGIAGFLTGAWDGIVEFFKGVPGKLAAAGRGMFDFIKDAFKSAINWVIRGWNNLEFEIPGFDPPGPGPSFGGFTLGLPNVPQLASGAIVKARPGGTLVNVGEGGKDEAVIPLDGRHGTGPTVQIDKVVMQAATPAQLRQELEFMFAARGL